MINHKDTKNAKEELIQAFSCSVFVVVIFVSSWFNSMAAVRRLRVERLLDQG